MARGRQGLSTSIKELQGDEGFTETILEETRGLTQGLFRSLRSFPFISFPAFPWVCSSGVGDGKVAMLGLDTAR